MKQATWVLCLVALGVVTLVSSDLLAEEEVGFTVSRTATEIAGNLTSEGQLLEFSSRKEPSGAVEMEISYPGALFEASFNKETSLLLLRGFGTVMLAPDRALIQQAHDELEQNQGDPEPSDRMYFLLERLLLYLADAPAGVVVDEMEIEIQPLAP